MDHAETKRLLESIKISVIVQERMMVHKTEGCDEAINRLANSASASA